MAAGRITSDERACPSGPWAGSVGAAQPSPGASQGAVPALRVTPIQAGGPRGVVVNGELDPATVSLLQAAVDGVCRTAPADENPAIERVFFLDLRAVTSLDPRGLWVLGRSHQQIDGRGDELRVAAPLDAGPRRLLLMATMRGRLDPLFSPWAT